MTQTYTLVASRRSAVGRAVGRLRSRGRLPGVVYGRGQENRVIELDAAAFGKIYAVAGASSLVDLVIDDATPVKVLIQEAQRDPLRGKVTHADFLQVNMKEKLTADIPLRFVGDSPAVRGLGGTLVKNRTALPVECLPADLVHEISLDISVLKTFNDALRVRDIAPPSGITFLAEPEEVVVFVEAPRSETELAELQGKVEASVETVEVVAKKKKEEEEAGAEPAKTEAE